jgi:hypothetical protein
MRARRSFFQCSRCTCQVPRPQSAASTGKAARAGSRTAAAAGPHRRPAPPARAVSARRVRQRPTSRCR